MKYLELFINGFVKAFEQYEVFGLIVICLGITVIAYTGIGIGKYMIGTLKKKISRNRVALVIIILTTVLYLRQFRTDIDYSTYRHFLYSFLLYCSVSTSLYLVIDFLLNKFKIIERVDSFFDKKGFNDKKTKK